MASFLYLQVIADNYTDFFFLSIPSLANISPFEPIHTVVIQFTVVRVRKLQPIPPLASVVQQPRHTPKRVAVHRMKRLGRITDRVERSPSLCQFVEPSDNFLDRSEERRVGKECRSRWSPY